MLRLFFIKIYDDVFSTSNNSYAVSTWNL